VEFSRQPFNNIAFHHLLACLLLVSMPKRRNKRATLLLSRTIVNSSFSESLNVKREREKKTFLVQQPTTTILPKTMIPFHILFKKDKYFNKFYGFFECNLEEPSVEELAMNLLKLVLHRTASKQAGSHLKCVICFCTLQLLPLFFIITFFGNVAEQI